MGQQRALILGASGLTGSQLLTQLLKDETFSQITALVRKPLDIQHEKLEQLITDFDNPISFSSSIKQTDVVFCCIGTTQKKVKGDKTAYYKIDFDIPVNGARYALDKGARKFLLVSAIGANSESSNFYLRLKGRVEETIQQFPFESVHIFQPSFLLGNRKETRIGEMIVKWFIKLIGWAIRGSINRYRPIDASVVAKAMITAAKSNAKGRFIYQYREMILMNAQQ